jgi:peptidoglycan hydrolase-like protein with peptidoglycan-binding domain
LKKISKKFFSLMLVVTMIFGLIMSDITTTTVEAATFTTTTTLKNGSTGTQVKYLQYGLVGLGYLKGSVDGKYGTATQTAVKNYQSANGLTVDGLAGAKTLSSIKTKVSNIQTKLKNLGYYSGTVDGVYGSGTTTAVKNYQKAKGLTVDGIAGTKTLSKLNGTTSSSSSSSSTTSSSSNTTYVKASIRSLYQTGDKSVIKYNGGKTTTVSKSGCGGVSLAMALNSLLGTTKYTGKNVMQWFADNGYYKGSGTIQSGLKKYPERLGLKATYCDSKSDIASHLKKGRLAIAIVKNKTGEAYFTTPTTSGHYILLSGYRVHNGVEQVYVNNPMKTKTSGWFNLSKLHANVKNENDGYTYSYVVVYK